MERLTENKVVLIVRQTRLDELIARFSGQFSGQRLTLSADQVKVWLNGADLRGLNELPYPTGSIVLLEDERQRYIGRGKVLRDRVRNLLPKR